MLSTLPLEIQAYILVFLPAGTLVRTLSLVDHHFHDLVEAHVQRYCLRYLGLGDYALLPSDDGVVLEFEAQRPIDTVTAKHTLQFSHFAPSLSTNNKSIAPAQSWSAVFTFSHGSSSRVATEFDRGARGSRRGRSGSVSVGPERIAPRPTPYLSTPFQPFLPGLHQNDQERATQSFVSSSLDLEERAARPVLSRNPSASSTHSSASRSTSGSRARAIANEIASAPFPFLRHSIETANRHSIAAPSNSSGWNTGQRYRTLRQTNDTTLGYGLEQPLDAYDWAGPPTASPAVPGGLESRGRKLADIPACYAFQLDPLDSFESLILTLTARRSVQDPNAMLSAIMRGEDPSTAGLHRLRYSKVLAEGLDRVFRDWFAPKGPVQPAPSTNQAPFDTLASTIGITNARAATQMPHEAMPVPKLLELDNSSCTLSIQPHASVQALHAHPALSSSSSHDYLSRPPLSAQYANLDAHDRVELTFHCQHVNINTARLLATLERLEHDVLASQAKPRVLFPRILASTSSANSTHAPDSAVSMLTMQNRPSSARANHNYWQTALAQSNGHGGQIIGRF